MCLRQCRAAISDIFAVTSQVRPITKAMIEKRCSEDTFDSWSPGVENTRVLPVTETRIKRQAISAEPLSSLAGMQGDLIKIPKSSL